jgi:hypothetical protein
MTRCRDLTREHPRRQSIRISLRKGSKAVLHCMRDLDREWQLEPGPCVCVGFGQDRSNDVAHRQPVLRRYSLSRVHAGTFLGLLLRGGRGEQLYSFRSGRSLILGRSSNFQSCDQIRDGGQKRKRKTCPTALPVNPTVLVL